MDRRKFLVQTPLAGAGLVGIAGVSNTRLYGQPQSSVVTPTDVDQLTPHLLRLHYVIAGVNPTRAQAIPAIISLAKAILADQTVAASFAQNPSAELARLGFNGAAFDTESVEFKMILALGNADVRKAVLAQDHVAFSSAISKTPVSDLRPPILPPGGGGGGEPCCAKTVVSVNVAVNITVVGSALAAVVAVVAVVASVVVLVAAFGEQPVPAQTTVQANVAVAKALGGTSFSQDVVQVETRRYVAELVAGIQSGAIALQHGVTPQLAIDAINAAMLQHQF